jgi:hypothetical protein
MDAKPSLVEWPAVHAQSPGNAIEENIKTEDMLSWGERLVNQNFCASRLVTDAFPSRHS